MRDIHSRSGTRAMARPELRLPWWSAALIVIAVWGLFAYPWLMGRVTIPYDAKALFQAQLQFLARAIHTGQSPAWNPHSFVGVPQIADPQSFIFSPGLLLAALSASPSFWLLDVYVFLLLGLGAGAILLIFRDRGWHPGGAAVAAICFAFGGSASWRMQHIGQIQSYALFALTLWLIFRARDRRSQVWGAAAGLTAGLMVAEPDQVAMLACYLIVLVLVTDWLASPKPLVEFQSSLPSILAAAAVALLVAAVPVLLTYVFLTDSNRPVIEFAEAARGSLHPASLLTFLVPDLYGTRDAQLGYWGPYSVAWDPSELTLSPNMSQIYIGALPCLLIMRAAVARGVLWRAEIRGYTIAAGAALIYALGVATPLFRIAYDFLPGVALFRRPADATFLFGGFLAIVAGYLVHLRLNEDDTRDPAHRRRKGAILVALLLIGAIVAIRHHRFGQALGPLISAVVLLIAADRLMSLPGGRLRAAGRLAVFIPALMVGADLAANNGPSESTGKPVGRGTEALKPDTHNETIAFLARHLRRQPGTPWRDRIEMAGVGFDWQNAAEAHGFDQTLGYNPLRTALVTRALGAGDYIAGPDQRTFSPLFPSYKCRLADLLGLRFIATPVPIGRLDRRIGAEDLNLLIRTPDAYLYENPRALPRVMFAEQAMAADFNRILADGRWPDFDPRHTVLLDAKANHELIARLPPKTTVSLATALKPAIGSATVERAGEEASAIIVRYENTLVSVDVDAPRPGYLVLGDVWHPWWSATVDGHPSRILRANVMFRAVAVPAGRHRINFEFHALSGAISEVMERVAARRP
jgi:hypothetical protein